MRLWFFIFKKCIFVFVVANSHCKFMLRAFAVNCWNYKILCPTACIHQLLFAGWILGYFVVSHILLNMKCFVFGQCNAKYRFNDVNSVDNCYLYWPICQYLKIYFTDLSIKWQFINTVLRNWHKVLAINFDFVLPT